MICFVSNPYISILALEPNFAIATLVTPKELEEMRYLAIARIQKTMGEIQKSNIAEEAKWALLEHNTYSRLWKIFHRGNIDHQRNIIHNLSGDLAKELDKPYSVDAEPPEASPKLKDEELFSFDHLEAVTRAIEAGGGDWMVSLPIRDPKPRFSTKSTSTRDTFVDTEEASNGQDESIVGSGETARGLGDAHVQNSVGDSHTLDATATVTINTVNDTEAEKHVGKNHKANKKKAEAKKQKRKAKVAFSSSQDQQSIPSGSGRAKNTEGFTGPMFNGKATNLLTQQICLT